MLNKTGPISRLFISKNHLPEQAHVDSVSQALTCKDGHVDDVGDDANRDEDRENTNVYDTLHSCQGGFAYTVYRFGR